MEGVGGMLRQEVRESSAEVFILLEAPAWVLEQAGQGASIPLEPFAFICLIYFLFQTQPSAKEDLQWLAKQNKTKHI